ncbi:PREDICTED: transcription factor Adf-1-like [Rhagoletis zephyria]|uniref:transcription factor Adf-1-like n=1 Tax=Rhagoletis zephyria TaxID=28612 RepID=UPI0008114F80|nr:PREDICTED: transcription factor Adf-1-like [Rhagoletis zephyria]
MEYTLIQAIQMHPCLFDKSVPSYRNKLAKEKAWNYVAAAAGASVEQCQSRWRSLRDRFVKESRKAPSGSAAKDIGGWQYMEAMGFLARHVAPRQTFGNTTFDSVGSVSPQTEQHIMYESQPNSTFIASVETFTPQTEQYVVCDSQLIFEQEEPSQPEVDFVAQSPTPMPFSSACSEEGAASRTSRQTKRKRDEDRFDTLCGAVSDWLQKSEKAPQPVSRNAEFLKVLDGYLLKYPEELQDRFKIDILNFVHSGGQSF